MTEQEGILLRALDGSNPLAFLAALGTFRLLTLEKPGSKVQMRWERTNGAWRPRLLGVGADEEELCRILHDSTHWAPAEKFMDSLKYTEKRIKKGKEELVEIAGNITVPKETFKQFVKESADATREDRTAADFAASFGCEVCEQEGKDRIEYTDFCFITGSGHQDFLGTMSALAGSVTAAHLRDALFGEWKTDKSLSMRWDPSDAAEYALQWDDPGPKGAWAVWGANRLASEALPLFPTAPIGNGLHTTGFRREKGRDEFTWPIWKDHLELASARSLLALGELQEDQPRRDQLSAMGVSEIYRAQRVRIGQGANFKVSFRTARAL